MKGKRLTDEEKKERFDKYVSIVLSFKTDTLQNYEYNFLKENEIEVYKFKKKRNVNINELYKKMEKQAGINRGVNYLS